MYQPNFLSISYKFHGIFKFRIESMPHHVKLLHMFSKLVNEVYFLYFFQNIFFLFLVKFLGCW